MCPEHNDNEPLKYYAEVAQKMSQNEEKTMYVNFSHLSNYQHDDPAFIENIVQFYYKFEPDMNRALTRLMGHHIEQTALKKSYFQIAIYNLPHLGKIRDLRSLGLGRLATIYGTVTRTTDTKPELI